MPARAPDISAPSMPDCIEVPPEPQGGHNPATNTFVMTLDIDFDTFDRDKLMTLLRTAPKAELHIHIEGSLEPEPEPIFELAKHNQTALPYASVAALRDAYGFTSLRSFLDVCYAGASVLRTEDAFDAMAWVYFVRAARDNIVHTEIFFDPQTHTARAIDMGIVIRGLVTAVKRAEAEPEMSVGLVPCFLRHLSEDDALATLESALPYRDQFIGLDSTRLERDGTSAGNVQARVRARSGTRTAPGRARRRGRPSRVYLVGARQPARRTRRPRRALPRGLLACRAPRARARAADRLPTVQREAARLRLAAGAQRGRAACQGPARHDQFRRSGLLRRLPQRQPRGTDDFVQQTHVELPVMM